MRLLPKPYNHPVRTAESVAVLDLVSDGRVEFGTGRSSTRAEIEGFGLDPHETREMWDEALRHIVGIWTTTSTRSTGKYWSMPPRRVHPKPLQQPHPPIWGATSSLEGHYEIGKHGIGLLSFTVGLPPETARGAHRELPQGARRLHRTGRRVREQHGRDVHDGALQRHQREGTGRRRRVVHRGIRRPRGSHIATLAEYMAEQGQDLGNYGYAGEALAGRQSGFFDHLNMDYIYDRARVSSATPTAASRCASATKRSAASCCSAC